MKMKTMLAVAFVAAAAAIALLATAWTGESSATAKQNFCTSLSDFSGTVMNYQGLNPATATNDQLEDAADDINDSWDDVVDDANDWANAYDNPLTGAYNDLYYAIQDVPGDYTVAQTINEVQPELEAIPSAYAETFDGSGCTTTDA